MKELVKTFRLWYYYLTDEQREIVKEIATFIGLLILLGLMMAVFFVAPYFILK